MKSQLHALVIVLFCWGPVTSAELPPSWEKDIVFELGQGDRDALTAISLDADIYNKSPENLAALRILTAEGQNVSYKMIHEADTKTQTLEHRWTPSNVSLNPEGNQLQIEFSLEKSDPTPSRLELKTPLRNFEHRVRVYGVGDNEDRLLADEVIFDYQQYMDIRRTELLFGETAFRRFRLVIEDPTAEQESRLLQMTRQFQGNNETGREERFLVEPRPFRIDQLSLVSTVERHVPNQLLITDWNVKITQQLEDEKLGQTHIEFNSSRQPLTQITLNTTSCNFSRRVWIETHDVRGVKPEWNQLAEGRYSQYSFGDYEKSDLTLTFPETRSETYRLVIVNHDSDPLQIDGLSAGGYRHQILFLADANVSYELHYGSSAETGPSYDTAAIDLMQAKGVTPIIAKLGPEVQLSDDAGKQRGGFKEIINNPYVLGAIVLILALVLGYSLYQASRKVSQMESSDTSNTPST